MSPYFDVPAHRPPSLVLISSRTHSETQHAVTGNVPVQSPAQHGRPTGHGQWHVRFLCTGDGHERRHVSVREASLPAMRAAPISQGAFENHDAWACTCVQTWRGAAARRRIERARCALQRMPAAHPIGLSHLVSIGFQQAVMAASTEACGFCVWVRRTAFLSSCGV